ncbi:hypothetical protein [Cohnella sp. REN36]|uniref:hypothetical protein n=1 Tax=Cohnella sp. REN36 TaxID=2887347 RepID=UPI001D14F301|nr:hypothetical protein [Cohnella sp. REN36]MCC3376387.1 hypothetical protein [Cohnella sp. REN36]
MSKPSRAYGQKGRISSRKRRRKSAAAFDSNAYEVEGKQARPNGGWGNLPGGDWDKDPLYLAGLGPTHPEAWTIGGIGPLGPIGGSPADDELEGPKPRGRSRAGRSSTYGRRR